MTPIGKKNNDTKLLLTVAGCVTAAALGIVMLAQLASDTDEPQPARRVAAVERAPAAPPVDPLPPAIPAAFESVVDEPTPPVPEEPAGPEFVIGPDENFVARGLEAWSARDYARSAAYFRAEAQARPERAWTHYMIGLSLWKDGSLEQAESAMQLAAELDPASVPARVNLARIRNERGDFEGALDAARAALTIDAEDPSALFLEGRSLYNLDRLDEAQTALEASLTRDPDNGYAMNLAGLILIRRGRGAEAVDVLEQAAVLLPQVAFVSNNLGMALELDGERDAAVAAYRHATELDPSHAKAASNLARLQPVDVPKTTPVETLAAVDDTSPLPAEPVEDTSDEAAEGSTAVDIAAASEDSLP